MAVTLNMTANEFVDLVTRAAEASLGEAAREKAEARREADRAAFAVWEPYDPEKTYRPLNKVLYEGSTYVCLREAAGITPSADSPDWLLCAARGEPGPRGEPGETYILPVASPEVLGGVRPVVKTAEMTQAVGVDERGSLWTLMGGNSYIAGPGLSIEEDAISVKISTAEGNLLEVVDGALYCGIGQAAGGCAIMLTFESVFKGQEFTITGPNESYHGVVDASLSTSVPVKKFNTIYTISSTNLSGITRIITVTTGSEPGQYPVRLTDTCLSTTLNANTWAQIREVSNMGTGPNYWSIGDAKSIIINGKAGNTTFSNLTVDAFIIGFDHNSSIEGPDRIHFEIGKINDRAVAFVDEKYAKLATETGWFSMNISDINTGGWKLSKMRTTQLGNSGTPSNPPSNTFLACLPGDLRAAMKSCVKYSDNTGGGSDTAGNVTATMDYLFLLSEFEYYGIRRYANSAEKNYQLQYEYYKNENSKVKYRHNAPTTSGSVHIWTRSSLCGSTAGIHFLAVSAGGGASLYQKASLSIGVAPAFCV